MFSGSCRPVLQIAAEISLDRVLRDSTGAFRTERVIVQAKH
jgi:hypothetical protein